MGTTRKINSFLFLYYKMATREAIIRYGKLYITEEVLKFFMMSGISPPTPQSIMNELSDEEILNHWDLDMETGHFLPIPSSPRDIPRHYPSFNHYAFNKAKGVFNSMTDPRGRGGARHHIRRRRVGGVIPVGMDYPTIHHGGLYSPMSYSLGGAIHTGRRGRPRKVASPMSFASPIMYGGSGSGGAIRTGRRGRPRKVASPMSMSHLVGGMINPMLPDGSMMTQKQIKAVQARNRRMNKRMLTGMGMAGIGGARHPLYNLIC